MTGPTHRMYSICFAYLMAILFFRTGLSEVNYYLTIPILLATSKYGALFPDVDHDWSNVHDKSVTNKIINIVIHVTGGKHRSWQTHSLDIWVYFTIAAYIIPNKLCENGAISVVNKEVLSLLLLGFSSGWLSHLFSDSLTSAGIRLFFFNKKIKIRFVPKKIGKLRFNTGNEWEKFNYTLMKYINVGLGFVCLAYPIILDYI